MKLMKNKERKKMKKTKKYSSKPINIAVLNLPNCKGGVHEKTNKSKRKKEKQKLLSQMRKNEFENKENQTHFFMH